MRLGIFHIHASVITALGTRAASCCFRNSYLSNAPSPQIKVTCKGPAKVNAIIKLFSSSFTKAHIY